ncbi:hypothetical protein BG005_001300 [Podila minutissima]|nr:hypothetical protein BG005_001300 [Podila minutissima]
MQERVPGSQEPYVRSSTSSSSTTVTDLSSDDATKCAQKEKNPKAIPFQLSISNSDQSDQASTSSSDHDPTVYCSSEAPVVGGRICILEGDGASPSDRVPWPTQFVHPESIYNSVAEYEQACLKNALVALGRLDGSVNSKCLFPKALLTLLPRVLSLANNRRLFFDHDPEATKAEKESNLVASHENIFDGVRIVFTHKHLNPSSLIVDTSTGDLLGLINLQYAGFFPEYTEPIRQLLVDTPESASPTLAFLNTDPSEQKDSDVEDDVLRKRKSFKGLVDSIIRRSSGSHRRQPSTDDTTCTVSKGNGKAIAKRTRIIVPFSRTGGRPFPFATVNHFTTNDPLSASPKSMIFTKKTRRTRCEGTHFTLAKAINMSEPKKGSFRSVSWIKRHNTNCTIETKQTSGSDSCLSSPVDLQAREQSSLESNDARQEPHKVSRHVVVPKARHLCFNTWQHFLGSLREYEAKWVDRQTRVRLSARILQDHYDSYRNYMQDLTPAGEDKRCKSMRSSSSSSLIRLSNSGVTPLTVIKSQQDASSRPPSTVSTHSAVILSNPDTGSARGSKSSMVPDTDVASSWATRDSDRIEHGYGPVLEAFVSMTKTLQNLVVALEAGARVLTPEQFLRMIEAKARKENSAMLQGQNQTSHRPAEDDAQQPSLTEEQKRQQQLYRMVAAASSAVSSSSSFEPAMPQPKPKKRSRVKRLLKSMFNSKRPEQLVASYQPPIRTSEDNILYMGPPERDPLPSELPSHLVFVAPPPKTKPFSTISFSSSSLRLHALQSSNNSTTHLSVDTSMDDGDTCSYNSDDTDEIRHQIAAPPVVISGGSHYGLPPSMGAIASDIPVYGVRLSACDGVRTLYESERERLEDEERRFWAEFEGEDRKVVQQQQRGSRQHGRVVLLDMNDLEANVSIIEEFLVKGSSKE